MLAASEAAANTPRNTADGGTLRVKQRKPGPCLRSSGAGRNHGRKPATLREERAISDEAPTVRDITAAVYVIPTDAPEADGTLAWDATTMVVASVRAGAEKGIGWTYRAAAAAQDVITGMLAGPVAWPGTQQCPGLRKRRFHQL
jgi:hypothetical protein